MVRMRILDEQRPDPWKVRARRRDTLRRWLRDGALVLAGCVLGALLATGGRW